MEKLRQEYLEQLPRNSPKKFLTVTPVEFLQEFQGKFLEQLLENLYELEIRYNLQLCLNGNVIYYLGLFLVWNWVFYWSDQFFDCIDSTVRLLKIRIVMFEGVGFFVDSCGMNGTDRYLIGGGDMRGTLAESFENLSPLNF